MRPQHGTDCRDRAHDRRARCSWRASRKTWKLRGGVPLDAAAWQGVPHSCLLGGCAGAVEDAGGGADVHLEGDAVVGVAGHAGHVGGVELPGEQGGGAEHVPQAVPGPLAAAGGVAPSGRQVGGA